MKQKIRLRKKAKTLDPAVRVGKAGLNESVIKELGKVLKKRKLVKIKLLKSSISKRNKEELIKSIATSTNSIIVEVVGNVVVVYRE